MENEETTEINHPDGTPDGTERVPLEFDNDTTIDDFLSAKAGVSDNIPEKEEKEIEVEATSEVPIKESLKQVETPAPEPPVKSAIVSRDEVLKSHGINDPQVMALLKKMPNDTFNYVKGLLGKSKSFDEEVGKYKTEIETYKAKKPETSHPTLYNHPEGYKLTPEYGQTEKAVIIAKNVTEHWIEQMAKIRRGEKWNDLTTDKAGNIFVVEEDLEGDVRAEVRVSKELTAAQQYLNRYESKLNELQVNHVTKRKSDESFIKEQENKFFPGYDDPKHETSEAQKKFREMLPDTMQEYVPTSIFVKTVANNAIFAQKVKALETELATLKNGKVSTNGTQPTKNKFTGTKAPTRPLNSMQDDEITTDDYKRVLGRY